MGIFGRIDTFITWFDGVVWGLPFILSGTDGMCRNGCIRWNQENCKSI